MNALLLLAFGLINNAINVIINLSKFCDKKQTNKTFLATNLTKILKNLKKRLYLSMGCFLLRNFGGIKYALISYEM